MGKASEDTRKVRKLTSRKKLSRETEPADLSTASPRRPRRSIGRHSSSLLSPHGTAADGAPHKQTGKRPKPNDAVKVRWALGQPRDFRYTVKNLLPPAIERGPVWLVPDIIGRAVPYDADGRLIAFCSTGPLQVPQAIIECGEQCVVRGEPRRCIEVFWAGAGTGWGVRALEDIRAGDFVCEYAGEVLCDIDAETRCLAAGAASGRDAYLFDLTTPRLCRAWGAHLVEESLLEAEDDDRPVFVIDAFEYGSVARFINHACGPSTTANICPVFVFAEDEVTAQIDARLPHVALFANRNIAIGEELRYDYAMKPGDINDTEGSSRSLACHCGSDVCRMRIY